MDKEDGSVQEASGPGQSDAGADERVLADQAREEQEELARYDEERRLRSRRRDRISRWVVALVMAVALAVLANDSARAALDARRAGGPWGRPATVAVLCTAVLVAILATGLAKAVKAGLRRRGRRRDELVRPDTSPPR